MVLACDRQRVKAKYPMTKVEGRGEHVKANNGRLDGYVHCLVVEGDTRLGLCEP